MTPTPYLLPVETIYRQIASPEPLQPKPVCVDKVDKTVKKITLNRADVDAIIQRTRGASAVELEYVIAHSKKFSLSDGQPDQLCCDLIIIGAQRARQGNGREDPNAHQFIAQVASV
jgi:hypothetical protein